MGKRHFIIIVAEGLKIANQVSKEIFEKTGIESRTTILGYVQRGGSPSAADRVLASKMGCYAVELINNGILNQVVAVKDNKIINISLNDAIEAERTFDMESYKESLEISI